MDKLYAESEECTSQALRTIHVYHHFSLSRLKRAAKRAKFEAKVLTYKWDKRTFIYDIFGPKDTWMVPGYEV